MMKYVYFNDKVMPGSEAFLPIGSQSIQYGLTAFAGMRGYYLNQKLTVFRLKDHYERLMDAVKVFGGSFTFSFDDFVQLIDELVEKNKVSENIYIRAFIYLKDTGVRPIFHEKKFSLGIYFVETQTLFSSNTGMKLMVSSWQKFSDAAIPTKAKAGGAYINSALASSEAIRCGYDEALVMDRNGYIVEASVANLFLHYRDTVLSPPVSSDILEGITMRSILEFLKDLRYEHRFELFDRSRIYTADALLVCGTAIQVKYAESVDGRVIGSESPPKLYVELRKCFKDVIEGKNAKYAHWLYHFPLKGKK